MSDKTWSLLDSPIKHLATAYFTGRQLWQAVYFI